MRCNPWCAVVLALAAACGQNSSSAVPVIPAASAGGANARAPEPAAAGAPAPMAAAPEGILAGTVVEKIDAKQYSYLRLKTESGEVWAAVPKSDIAVGAPARIAGAMWMENFKSPSMDRTWPRIAFGTLEAGGAVAQPGSRQAGMFAQAAMDPNAPMAAPAAGAAPQMGSPRAPPPDGTPIQVPRAKGKGAHSIAEVYAKKASLKDQVVTVSGKVVKETDHVMGKNWLHLRDGTGKDAASDLTFATEDASAVGETVVLTGVVHLDRDLGAGYHYDVLVEDAHIAKP